jgi:hypothetical protein
MAWAPDYVLLADAKNWVRIGDTVDDDEIDLYITATSRGIDDHCNRQFGNVAAEARLYTAWYDSERARWVVDVDDFMSTTGGSITIGGVATTDYVKEPVNADKKGRPWTAISIDARTAAVVPTGAEFEVSAVMPWGWTAFPAGVKLAARLQISRFLARRESPFGVAGAGSDNPLRLLAKLDVDAINALRGLVRPRKAG